MLATSYFASVVFLSHMVTQKVLKGNMLHKALIVTGLGIVPISCAILQRDPFTELNHLRQRINTQS